MSMPFAVALNIGLISLLKKIIRSEYEVNMRKGLMVAKKVAFRKSGSRTSQRMSIS